MKLSLELNFDPLRRVPMAERLRCYGGGGGSSATSNTNTQTSSNRQVAGSNFELPGNQNTVNVTDAGATKAAIDAAQASAAKATALAAASMDQAAKILDSMSKTATGASADSAKTAQLVSQQMAALASDLGRTNAQIANASITAGTVDTQTIGTLAATVAKAAADNARGQLQDSLTFAGNAGQEVMGLLADTFSQSSQAIATTTENALNKFADIKETIATDGQSNTNKMLLYLGLGLIAVTGISLLNRK